MTREQVESALLSYERSRGTRLLAHLTLSPDQIRQLENSPEPPPPPEAAEAMKDSSRRAGRYWLAAKLGSGGMGVVYRAWDESLKRWVALKFLKQLGDDTARAYFRREAELAAALEHPHIAKIHEIGEHEGAPFIAMQLIEGDPLARAQKEMTLERKLATVRSIAEAVSFAHGKGIIHRDLKPANVMVDAAGRITVMDFGLAKRTEVGGESVTGTNQVLGTPSYMAPEQARGRATAQSDLYSIGATLYEMVTGRPPFVGESSADVLLQVVAGDPIWPRALAPGTPEDVEAIILKCLEKDLSRRYSDGGALLEDLEALAQGQPLRHARRRTWSYVLGKRIRRQPVQWTLAMGLVLALLGGAVFGTLQLVRANRSAQRVIQETQRRVAEVTAEREETDRRRREAQERLAFSYLFRGRTLEAQGDDPSAAIFFAEAAVASPSSLARASALRSVRRLCPLRAILPHEFDVDRVAFDPAGRWLATVGELGGPRFWDAQTGTPLSEPLRGSGQVWTTAFAVDRSGARIAAGCEKGIVYLWEAPAGRSIGATIDGGSWVTSLAFRSDGKRLAVATKKTGARIWDVESGRAVGEDLYGGAGLEVRSIAYGPDGRVLATGGADRCAHLWDGSTGKRLSTMKHGRTVDRVMFSHDGSILLTLERDGPARLWEGSTGAPIAAPLTHPHSVSDAVFSPDGRRLATGCADGGARLWDVSTGEPIRLPMAHRQAVTSLRFDSTGRLFTASRDGTARLWTGTDGYPLHRGVSHAAEIVSIALRPDGRIAATAGSEKTVRLWELPEADLVTTLGPLGGTGNCVAFSADGRRLAAGSTEGTARVWDASTGAPVGPRLRHGVWITSLAFSPDGSLLATAGFDGTARIWSVETGEPVGIPLRHREWITRISFRPDGRRLLTGSQDRTARLWDVATGEPVGPPMEHKAWVIRATFSPDGRRVLTAVHGTTIRLWDADSAEPAGASLEHPGGVLTEAVFSPDGARIATASTDRTVRLWRIGSSESEGPPLPHAAMVNSVRFSPDSRLLATGCSDKTARFWDVETRRPVGKVMRATQSVDKVLFSPDGRWLLTVETGTLRLWAVPSGEPLGRELESTVILSDAAFRPDGRQVAGVGLSDLVRVWDVSYLSDPVDPHRLLREAQVRSGFRLDRAGEIEAIPPDEWRTLREGR